MKIKHFMLCAVAALAITACGGGNTVSGQLDKLENLVEKMEKAAKDGDYEKVQQLATEAEEIGNKISEIEKDTPATPEEEQRAMALAFRMIATGVNM